MKVFLTGSTGFVGSYVLRALLDAGHDVRVLVRPGSETRLHDASDAVDIVRGDVTDADSLDGLLDGCEGVVHLVGIIREDVSAGATFERVHLDGARNVIDAATAAGVQRFVLMSANGAKPREDAVSAYQWTKYEAEEHLRASDMEHVIFRPSVIFGRPSGGQPEFASELAGSLLGVPLAPLPLFKDGFPTVAEVAAGLTRPSSSAQRSLATTGSEIELQPVAVEDVAAAMAKAVDRDGVSNTTYDVGGRDRFRWGQLLDVLTLAKGARPRRKIVVPAFLIRFLLGLPIVRSLLPLTADQLDMLLAGNVCDEGPFVRDFDIEPIRFAPDTVAYVGTGVARVATATASSGKYLLRHYDPPAPNTGIGHAKFGMWVFLASEVMFFTGLIGAYIILRNATPGWPDPGDRLSLGLTAFMTFLLIVSSMTLVLSLSAIQRGLQARFKLFLGLTVLCGAAFVGLQVYEWSHFLAHSAPSTDMFWGVFYTLTGFHGAHVTIGVVALAMIYIKALRGGYTETQYGDVEMTGLYWHFVDLVWIILFTIIYLI
ncbi:NAD(P)H-binding protein [Candidatus Poribacteria bacterium]|jgi:heme/copper-type cytochrome/quinol oxidase subunit 3/uncharacterized protein YbjT (DUF2867 family)|nr:NAD(P)H-binding protein [Candidatus Poribacteria bacterium]MBT5533894.1 NAD(P)H-binding protein [Candidatus Poribacteria bacterium]MBT5713941.1 NAD(P)H-binding protein [Candidatus Poribacteria bacterium]MBT7097396.1 NAD(P)H-binding protein [Candidatus Poribacteria bacterium]MBT7804597.1 NAD(P)H-binding protein [Candidatus Poribacteria bacterium]